MGTVAKMSLGDTGDVVRGEKQISQPHTAHFNLHLPHLVYLFFIVVGVFFTQQGR